jgi:hypothetical protein
MDPRVKIINPARKQHRVSFALHDANNLIILIIMPFLYTLFVIDNPEDDHKNIYGCWSNPRPIVPRLENHELKIEPVPDILALSGKKMTLRSISNIYNC